MKETDTNFLDSSIWIAYYFENKFAELMQEEEHFLISALSIFEIKRLMLKKGVPQKEVNEKLQHIKDRSLIIAVTWNVAEEAADVSHKRGLPMADALIYVSATQNKAKLHTLDRHFKKLDKVVIYE